MRLRHLVIRLVTPLVWRWSEKRKLAALQEFSDTELDSGWQSLYAIERIDDPQAKAELFQHTLEEFYHAEMFSHLLHSYSNAPLNRPAFAREAILAPKGDRAALLEFLTQVYVGEAEINRDFVVYAGARVDAPIRELFGRIKKDEEGHEEVSWNLMLRYCEQDVWRLRRVLLRKRLAHFWKRYVKASQFFGNTVLSAQLTLVYFLLGGFFFIPLRRRMALDRATQLGILRQQLKGAGAPR